MIPARDTLEVHFACFVKARDAQLAAPSEQRQAVLAEAARDYRQAVFEYERELAKQWWPRRQERELMLRHRAVVATMADAGYFKPP
jgi:hypothetical protein